MDAREAPDHGARRRAGAPHRRAGVVLLATLIGLLAAGCGSEDGDGGDAGETQPAPATELTIMFWPQGPEGESTEATLTCDPAGGTHPNPEAACALLAVTSDPEVLAPVPPDTACTMIFGGPEQATVVGIYAGEEIDAAFERSNGCELARWDQHAVLLQLGD